MDAESAVRERYSQAAQAVEGALCCPVDYDPKYLEVIPAEVIERDYGCGDPSKHLKAGETVLDLGSGTGKICFIAAQVVGPEGRVIGVDMNDEMLGIAQGARETVAGRIGYDNVEFRKSRIQDMRGVVDDGSVDVVVSNCVLNLVATDAKKQLFAEIFRVLKRGGRAVISDIVSDERVPEAMQKDPELWSGCISGALQEGDFLDAFTDAGFYGVEILERGDGPWQTVEGIEFRTLTLAAYKGKEGACYDHNEAVVYLGPFSEVSDDDGHVYPRGQRVAVCRKTFEILSKAPYAGHFARVEPLEAIPEGEAAGFPCNAGVLLRHPKQTKGEDYKLTKCGDSGCC